MRIEVTDLKGIETTVINAPDNAITAIIGENGSGKSSQAEPLKMLLSGTYPKQEEAAYYVREGAQIGTVVIERGEDRTEVSFPVCKPQTTGWPEADVYASGLLKFAEQKPTVQGEYLQDLLKTNPNINHLAKELKRRGIVKADTAKQQEEAKLYTQAVWSNIERKGWNGAYKDYQERGRSAKADWKAVTGETYGSNKGATYCPKGWEDELNGKSEETLRAELTECEALLEACVVTAGVEESKLLELREKCQGISEAAKERDEAIIKAEKLEAEYKEKSEAFKKLPRPAKEAKTFKCDHCGGELDEYTKKKPAARQTAEEVAKINKVISDAQAELDEMATSFQLAQNNALSKREIYYTKQNAKDQLFKLEQEKQKAETATSAAQVEAYRRAVEVSKVRLEAFIAKQKADKAHAEVEKNQAMIDLLEPDGWKQSFSLDAIKKLNEEYLLPMCKLIGCPPVRIDASFNILFNRGRIYKVCSGAEQWLINALFQIAFARIKEADLLIFDYADILGPKYCKGFYQLLSTLEIPSVIFMTRGADRIPDLKAMGIGVTYWLENGTAVEYQKEKVAA